MSFIFSAVFNPARYLGYPEIKISVTVAHIRKPKSIKFQHSVISSAPAMLGTRATGITAKNLINARYARTLAIPLFNEKRDHTGYDEDTITGNMVIPASQKKTNQKTGVQLSTIHKIPAIKDIKPTE